MKTDQTLRRNLKAAIGDATVIMVPLSLLAAAGVMKAGGRSHS